MNTFVSRTQTLMSSSIPFVDLVVLPEGPHPIPFRTRSLSLPGPMVLCLKARESRSPPGLQKGCPHDLTLHHDPHSRESRIPAPEFDAGWSSPVARQAHNLKVTGSNPVPAPKFRLLNPRRLCPRGFCLSWGQLGRFRLNTAGVHAI